MEGDENVGKLRVTEAVMNREALVLQLEKSAEGAPAKIVVVEHQSHTTETETVVYVPVANNDGPDATQLAELGRVDASFPDRVMKQWEKQLSHDRVLELVESFRPLVIQVLGIASAFGLCFYALKIGADLIEKGRDVTGISLIIGALCTLAGVFVVGKLLPQRSAVQSPSTDKN